MGGLLHGTLWLVILATIAVVLIGAFMVLRFRTIVETNQRIERNQRRAVELTERQTAALERIADSLEKRG